MRRWPVLLASLALAAAGCGLADASAGVRVVSGEETPGDELVDPLGGEAAGVDGSTLAATDVDGRSDADAGTVDPSPPGLPATVAVVGDSLTLSAEAEIESVLTKLGLDVVAVDGVESRRMVSGGRSRPSGVAAIDEILADGPEPELWLIALGTNDVGAESSPVDFEDDVAAVLTRVPAGVPVIWIDLWIRDRRDEVLAANRALRSVTAIRPGTAVADWFANGDRPGVITRDGIHLTDLGRQVFADTMAAAVVDMFGR